mmetsp:Transcript_4157/g.9060  ORF Transcript_4157/g.9060 Transcript_4157/m.9060 type:complete len:80 (-) Transcript_4157:960-1199(-)
MSSTRLVAWRAAAKAASTVAELSAAFVMLLDSFKSSMVLNDEAAEAVHAAKLELRRGNLARNSGAVSEETLTEYVDMDR